MIKDFSQKIRNAGWRQGSIIPSDQAPHEYCIPPFTPTGDTDLLIVLTQDCDLVQSDLEKEPFVEVLQVTQIEGAMNGSFAFGKNPRILHFEFDGFTYQAICHNRGRFPREHLAGMTPINSLNEPLRTLLRQWMSKRYIRPAFPDEFNRRLSVGSTAKALKKLITPCQKNICNMFVSLHPAQEELPDDGSYRMMIWLCMTVEGYEDTSKRNPVEQSVEKIEEIIDRNCEGIELLRCEVRHEGQITLDDLNRFVLWDFDELTHREDIKS